MIIYKVSLASAKTLSPEVASVALMRWPWMAECPSSQGWWR